MSRIASGMHDREQKQAALNTLIDETAATLS